MKLAPMMAASALGFALAMSASVTHAAYVATTAIVEHPALDAVRDGVKAELEAQGFGDELKFTYESAQGQPAIAAQIARKLVGENPDVIVAIATPSAQAAVSATQHVPVVFSAVSDPIGAKVVPSFEASGSNVTGLSDMVNVQQHLALIKEFQPDIKRIGIPYNPGEANAVFIVEAMTQAAKAMGIEIVGSAAPKSSDVMIATKQLVGKVDAVYCSTDNTIVSAFESVVKVGIDAKLPVYAADTASVERGALAAVGYNYFDLGRQTGELVAKILKGDSAGNLDVKMAEGTELFVNRKLAARYGVSIPASVLERATKVVD